MIFLLFSIFATSVHQINDSRYVGMSIYKSVVLCLITAPVSLVISSQADASYAFVTLALVFCCFLSMALIFVPKVHRKQLKLRLKLESSYRIQSFVGC